MRTALAYDRILEFTDTPDIAFAPKLTHTDVLEFVTIDGARVDHARRQGRLALARQAGRHRPAQDRHDQHRAGARPEGDDRHLRRHVERRLGVRRRPRGQAQRAARRRGHEVGSCRSSRSRATPSSDRAVCCPSSRARRALGDIAQQPAQDEHAAQRSRSIDEEAAEHSNLGASLEALDRHDEAEAASRRAIALDPGLAIAHHNLGNLLHKQGHNAEAEVISCGAPHSSPHFFDGIKESGDHGGGFEKNRGVSADGRFLRIHPDDSPAPR